MLEKAHPELVTFPEVDDIGPGRNYRPISHIVGGTENWGIPLKVPAYITPDDSWAIMPQHIPFRINCIILWKNLKSAMTGVPVNSINQ
ncbi:MAG: hypothetical protein RL095_3915 [Verrucomicrobiota bacterium]